MCSWAELRASLSPPPTPPVASPAAAMESCSIADTIYRRFFLSAIASVLTAGASWGVMLLWHIGFAGKFTGVSLQHVNAHGQAQIHGWCGLFIMGFAYQAFPRLWHTELFRPRLAAVAFALTLAALPLRTFGMTAGTSPAALAAQSAGGLAQVAAAFIFAVQLWLTFRRRTARVEPYVGFVLAAALWMVPMTVLD